MILKIVPIDAHLLELKPEVSLAIDSFLKCNLPEAPPAEKAWAVYCTDGEAFKVVAFAGCNLGKRFADVPVFYVEPGTDRQTKWAAAKAAEMLTDRLSGYIADNAGFGAKALIRIEPSQEHIWSVFVGRLGAVAAERFMVEV